ncbi:MAG: hypothetical protein IPN89_08790 [Saprospiraceae bacterium]|nr:hypothetical protein [Saprospiraceae bacterium]
MNRIILALSFIFALSATSEAQKIGYINSQEILFSLPEVKQANSDIDVMKAMFQKKGRGYGKGIADKISGTSAKTSKRRTSTNRNRKAICCS